MAGATRPRQLVGCIMAGACARGRGAALDSASAGGLGRAMALVMSPPDQAPDFLAEHGWGGAAILPLAGDASFRRYFRVVEAGRRAVLMDAPPEHEDCRPFLAVAEHLHG